MRLIPNVSHYDSVKNGRVTLVEFLWHKKLYAGGFEQSGPYLVGLWNSAFTRVVSYTRARSDIRSILFLGLGLGENVRLAQKFFPHASITIIEWDSVIIELARSAGRFDAHNTTIIEGDLRTVLPSLTQTQTGTQTFDLICADAFFGDQPDVGVGTDVGASFARLLSPGGTLVLNASRTPAAIDYLSKFLKVHETWRFKDNVVVAFSRS